MIVLALLALLGCAPLQSSPVRAPAASPRSARSAPRPAKAPTAYAVLVNGGAEPLRNYSSHLQHLQETRAALLLRGFAPEAIAIFDADGGDPAPDQLAMPADDGVQWLLVGTEYEELLAPTPRDSEWDVARQPATRDALKRWLGDTRFREGDSLLFYVTDHGSRDALSLWHEELSPAELAKLLDQVPATTHTVLVMSQCFAGSFQGALTPESNRCALYAVPGDRRAYGCFPSDGSARDGHAFAVADALPSAASWSALRDVVSLTDEAPDVPLMSSDVYLAQVMADADLDALLAAAGVMDLRAAMPQLAAFHALGRRFGLPAVRTSRELRDDAAAEEVRAKAAESVLGEWFSVLGAANALNASRAAQPSDRDRAAVQAALRAQAERDGSWPLVQALVEQVRASVDTRMAHARRSAVRERQLIELRRVAAGGLSEPQQARLGQLTACEGAAIGEAPSAPPPELPPAPARRAHDASPPNAFGLAVDGDVVVSVEAGSMAATAGLRVGDKLLQVDATTDPAWYTFALALHPTRVRFARRGVARGVALEWPEAP